MKIFISLVLLFLTSAAAFAVNYDYIFANTKPADFQLLKNIDPYQQEDYYNYAWTPYPLFRTSSKLVTQTSVIEAGYYLLVPRTMKERDYVFFKENGVVRHVVPVYKTEAVDELFYSNIMPQPSKTKWQKFTEGAAKKFYKTFNGSKKQAPPQAFIETVHLDGKYMDINLYYGDKKYSMLFKLEQY